MEQSTEVEVEVDPTAWGTLLYAEKYRLAADNVISNNSAQNHPLLMPAYHLVSHSIELSLKAYLLLVGLPYRRLRSQRYGHNLGKLLRKARAENLASLVQTDDADCNAVQLLGAMHGNDFEFRYIKTGFKTLPYWSAAESVAKKLTHGLHDRCLADRIGEGWATQRIATCGRF